MATKKTFDNTLHKNIRMVTDLLLEVHKDRKNLLNQMYDIYKQNYEFERMMQMSLLRMLSVQEFSASMGSNSFKKMIASSAVAEHGHTNTKHSDNMENAYQ